MTGQSSSAKKPFSGIGIRMSGGPTWGHASLQHQWPSRGHSRGQINQHTEGGRARSWREREREGKRESKERERRKEGGPCEEEGMGEGRREHIPTFHGMSIFGQ